MLLTSVLLGATQPWEAHAFTDLYVKEVAEGQLVDGTDFEFVAPRGFRDLGPPEVKKPAMGFAGGPGAPPPPSPIKARFVSQTGDQGITVVVKEASALKRTFTQVQDIRDWGSGADVSKVLLPTGARVLSFSEAVVPRPPRDTGSVMGVVELPPLHIYKYKFLSPSGQEVAMAAGAQKGRVYFMVVQGQTDDAEESRRNIELATSTFKCKEPFRPIY